MQSIYVFFDIAKFSDSKISDEEMMMSANIKECVT